MTKFRVYRATKSKERADFLRYTRPKSIKTIEAETAYDAAMAFANGQPRGWRDRIIEVSGRSIVRQKADLWMRYYTPSGRYKGETHYMIWPSE